MGWTPGAADGPRAPIAGSPRRAVLLFARTPAREAAAKRIARATPLFQLALRRVRRAAAAVGAHLVVVGDGWTPATTSSAAVLRQRGRGFGERFANAFTDVFALGFDQVVSVGIDAPRLSERHLRGAFEALGSAPLVLGPAADGGAYLIGCTGSPQRAFRGVRWCTGHVLDDLRRACGSASVLPEELLDVDAPGDVRRLASAAGADTELVRALAACLGAAPADGSVRTLSGPAALLASVVSRRGPPPRHV